jgi:hypothetical protein
MHNSGLDNELAIRVGFFFGIYPVMAVWEILTPRRPHQPSRLGQA